MQIIIGFIVLLLIAYFTKPEIPPRPYKGSTDPAEAIIRQKELADSQYRLGKMTKDDYQAMIHDIETRGWQVAEKKISELEKIVFSWRPECGIRG